jgi:hypothetical protein
MKNKITKQNKIMDTSKEFLLEFFKDCNIIDDKEVLIINNVSPEFENFVGKRAPYKFVFDINMHNKFKDSELIMQGSYFLLAIKDYLRDKGQTSLLKINMDQIPKELKIKKGSANFLYEFSFLSTYQYLNEKKQSMYKIIVKDKELLDIDISKLKTAKGNKNDIPIIDAGDAYIIAKKSLDGKVIQEIKPIKLLLRGKIDKELFRIRDHYLKQIKEKDEEVETCANKIKMLQGKLRHTSYERDINILKRLIRESQERLEMLKKRSYKERLKTEENFHINDEVEKHVLSIKNVLINLTVYYW